MAHKYSYIFSAVLFFAIFAALREHAFTKSPPGGR